MNQGAHEPAAHEPAAPWTIRVMRPDAAPETVLARKVSSADSFWGRFMGLMGRGSLPADEGLYIPGNSIHMFFMRFAIDAVFVGKPDAAGERAVVGCRPRLRPWIGLVMPVRGAAGVVELPVGAIDRAGIQVGAVLRFEAPISYAPGSGPMPPSAPTGSRGDAGA